MRAGLKYSQPMRRTSNDLTRLSAGLQGAILLATVLTWLSPACSSGGGGGPTPLGAAGVRWMPGTGNVAGGLGAAGAGGGRAFPTPACVTKAIDLLGMMTSDEKIAQLHQVERANTGAADITKYGVGSVYSQGGSGPTTNTPTGWADMID